MLLVKSEFAGTGVTGAIDNGSAILDSAGSGGASGSAVATSALAIGEVEMVEDAVVGAVFAAEVETGAAGSGADVGADGNSRPSLTRAKADDPANTNNMAATATLTSLPLT